MIGVRLILEVEARVFRSLEDVEAKNRNSKYAHSMLVGAL